MHESLQDALQPVVTRWTMGGAAAPLAPESLKDRLGDDPEEAEIRLLVIAGQALGFLVVPEPAGELEGLPDLPALSLPTMPDHLRPLAARTLSRSEEWLRTGVLRLITERGYVVHPADWMPSRTGTAPAIYAPWQDWLAGVSGDTSPGAGLNASWENLGPAGRRAMLSTLRERDPQAALDVVVARAASQPADQRLWMVEALFRNLSERDRPFLEGLLSDRAPTVRMAASRLLKRLGGTSSESSEEAERDIIDFLKVETSGLVRRKRIIVPIRPRNHPQAVRRANAINALDVDRLSAVLGITGPELPQMFPWGSEPELDLRMAGLVLGTGSDEVVEAFEAAINSGAGVTLDMVNQGIERLTAATVAVLGERMMSQSPYLPNVAGALPTPGVIADPDVSPAWRQLLAGLKRDGVGDASEGKDEMAAMGILLTKSAAQSALNRLMSLGIPGGDPRLDTLRINAGL